MSSVPIRKSVYDKLRPSLIELHSTSLPPVGSVTSTSSAPNSLSSASTTPTRSSLVGSHFDSIGSGSGSIFSGASSISSLSSGNRSSFGSISYEERKTSLVAPHERPSSPQVSGTGTVSTIEEDKKGEEAFSTPGTPLFKAKVSYLLDSGNGVKRQKSEVEDDKEAQETKRAAVKNST
ncbi:hypothetical protein QG37_04642 [Candidozyma auris]|nr:hypothetical protein QG37_04642 [[Candida] auris]